MGNALCKTHRKGRNLSETVPENDLDPEAKLVADSTDPWPASMIFEIHVRCRRTQGQTPHRHSGEYEDRRHGACGAQDEALAAVWRLGTDHSWTL